MEPRVSRIDSLPDVTMVGSETVIQDGSIRIVAVRKPECSDHIGFNLTRSQWDPYPWVKSVDQQSPAEKSGLREGDCLLRVNDEDLLGRKVSDVAKLVKNSDESIKLSVWSSTSPSEWDPEALVGGPLPDALRRLTKVVSGVLAALECPICCGTVRPPATSCPRGHLFCTPCRQPLTTCPMCRMHLNHQNPLRNLLADEVYNCVVEAFELFGDKAQGKLTDSLFGSAKISKNGTKLINGQGGNGVDGDAEFSTQEMNGRGRKWGTQRLLQRLLPGRARSTDNIARATMASTRDRSLSQDRDLSRSLSNLDMTRCTQSMNSLACTTGGSCASLPLSGFVPSISKDENLGCVETENNSKETSYYCPANPSCKEVIKGNLHEHILKSHGIDIALNPADTIIIDDDSKRSYRVLYHSTGHWFYPKCERDQSDEGILIWCWTDASNAIASQFQLVVEMWSDLISNESKKDSLNGFNRFKKRNLSLVDEMPENLLKHFEGIAQAEQGEFSIQEELPENNNRKNAKECDRDVKKINIPKPRPILKFTSPTMSLQNISWSQVIGSHLALFVGDSLLCNDYKIKISIEEIN